MAGAVSLHLTRLPAETLAQIFADEVFDSQAELASLLTLCRSLHPFVMHRLYAHPRINGIEKYSPFLHAVSGPGSRSGVDMDVVRSLSYSGCEWFGASTTDVVPRFNRCYTFRLSRQVNSDCDASLSVDFATLWGYVLGAFPSLKCLDTGEILIPNLPREALQLDVHPSLTTLGLMYRRDIPTVSPAKVASLFQGSQVLRSLILNASGQIWLQEDVDNLATFGSALHHLTIKCQPGFTDTFAVDAYHVKWNIGRRLTALRTLELKADGIQAGFYLDIFPSLQCLKICLRWNSLGRLWGNFKDSVAQEILKGCQRGCWPALKELHLIRVAELSHGMFKTPSGGPLPKPGVFGSMAGVEELAAWAAANEIHFDVQVLGSDHITIDRFITRAGAAAARRAED